MPIPLNLPVSFVAVSSVCFYSLIRIISLLVLACVLQACSAVRLAYNQVPELAYWYLDDYVDFSSAQGVQVKADLNRILAWHRQTQLPAYIETLQKLQLQVPGEMSPQEVCAVFSDVRRKLLVLSEQTHPAVLTLLETLKVSQLEVMQRKFEKGNLEFQNDYLQPALKTSHAKRYKQAISRAKMLYGKLDDKQSALIARQVEASTFDARLSYAERLRRQRDLLQTLDDLSRNHHTPGQKRVLVRSLLERSFSSPNAAYREYSDALAQESCKNITDFHITTSPTQRLKAIETLNGYEQDFKALAGQSPG